MKEKTRFHLFILSFLTVSSMSLSLNSFALDPHKAIYEALNIKAINMIPEGMCGTYEWEKTLRGLTCTKSGSVTPYGLDNPRFNCLFDKDNHDAKGIYKALKIKEHQASYLDPIYFEKNIGFLSCTKTLSRKQGIALSHSSYLCKELTF